MLQNGQVEMARAAGMSPSAWAARRETGGAAGGGGGVPETIMSDASLGPQAQQQQQAIMFANMQALQLQQAGMAAALAGKGALDMQIFLALQQQQQAMMLMPASYPGAGGMAYPAVPAAYPGPYMSYASVPMAGQAPPGYYPAPPPAVPATGMTTLQYTPMYPNAGPARTQ